MIILIPNKHFDVRMVSQLHMPGYGAIEIDLQYFLKITCPRGFPIRKSLAHEDFQSENHLPTRISSPKITCPRGFPV